MPHLAIVGDRLLATHDAGLGIFSLANRAKPEVTRTIDIGFSGTNVDSNGTLAVVLGSKLAQDADIVADSHFPLVACVNLETNAVTSITLPDSTKTHKATISRIAMVGDKIFVAAGEVFTISTSACNPGAASDWDQVWKSTREENSCVEEDYLISRGISRKSFLHDATLANVLCPRNGLPCGTETHVVRSSGEYLTYKELCEKPGANCSRDTKLVNGVSMLHARALCEAGEEHCVVPHVMRTGFEMERMIVRSLHRRIVA